MTPLTIAFLTIAACAPGPAPQTGSPAVTSGEPPSPVPSTLSPTSEWTSPTLGAMMHIPAGTFTMGSTRQRDETPHQVTLTRGYWMMAHEVTQAEYQAVTGTNPSKFMACGAECPVEQVSWEDAVTFAEAASARDGVKYRLPSEAEWEYAARGGQSSLYAGSDEAGTVAWTAENSQGTTHTGCGKQRNGYGLCDMSGNVWEWTQDRSADYGSDATTDPAGPSSGYGRVIRGGGLYPAALYATVSSRGVDAPVATLSHVGFRLVRTSPP